MSGVAIDNRCPRQWGRWSSGSSTRAAGRSPNAAASAPVAVSAKHVCLLFRRFVSWQTDVTRPYVEALEARGIPHVLVGGRAFHEREEIEAIRAALAAVEWPDDELSVFATLRGPFFAISDEDLLEWAYRFDAGFAPVPRILPADIRRDAPESRSCVRSPRPAAPQRPTAIATTAAVGARRSGRAARATRAHVGFALRIGGEQALANLLHVAELARQDQLGGGISFRGFVEELRAAADTAQASEAPILEEDSDGVRMMTVHKAKGLEFPIVILADSTCQLSRPEAGRWIDPAGIVRSSWADGRHRPAAARRRGFGRIAPKGSARLRRRDAGARCADHSGDRRRSLRRRLAESAGTRRSIPRKGNAARPSAADGYFPAFPSKDTVIVAPPTATPPRPTTVALASSSSRGSDSRFSRTRGPRGPRPPRTPRDQRTSTD